MTSRPHSPMDSRLTPGPPSGMRWQRERMVLSIASGTLSLSGQVDSSCRCAAIAARYSRRLKCESPTQYWAAGARRLRGFALTSAWKSLIAPAKLPIRRDCWAAS